METAARRSGVRWQTAALVVAVLVIGALVLNARQDPYRVGTTHDVVLDPGSNAAECGPGWIVHLENGSTWIPTAAVGEPVVAIPGTLTITDVDRARFESSPEVDGRTVTMTPGSIALVCAGP